MLKDGVRVMRPTSPTQTGPPRGSRRRSRKRRRPSRKPPKPPKLRRLQSRRRRQRLRACSRRSGRQRPAAAAASKEARCNGGPRRQVGPPRRASAASPPYETGEAKQCDSRGDAVQSQRVRERAEYEYEHEHGDNPGHRQAGGAQAHSADSRSPLSVARPRAGRATHLPARLELARNAPPRATESAKQPDGECGGRRRGNDQGKGAVGRVEEEPERAVQGVRQRQPGRLWADGRRRCDGVQPLRCGRERHLQVAAPRSQLHRG